MKLYELLSTILVPNPTLQHVFAATLVAQFLPLGPEPSKVHLNDRLVQVEKHRQCIMSVFCEKQHDHENPEKGKPRVFPRNIVFFQHPGIFQVLVGLGMYNINIVLPGRVALTIRSFLFSTLAGVRFDYDSTGTLR